MAVRTSVTAAMVSSAAATTVTFGAGAAAGNAALLVIETAKQNLPSTPTGFTSLVIQTSAGTAGAAAATQLSVYYKASISAGDISGGIAIGDSGDHQNGVLITYSGCDPTTPFVATLGIGGVSVATTSLGTDSVAQASVTVNDILLGVFATDRDSATVSTNTSPAWGNIAGSNSFLVNGSSATGAGGGIIVNELLPSGAPTGNPFFQFSATSTIYAASLVVVKAPVAATSFPPVANLNAMLPLLVR